MKFLVNDVANAPSSFGPAFSKVPVTGCRVAPQALPTPTEKVNQESVAEFRSDSKSQSTTQKFSEKSAETSFEQTFEKSLDSKRKEKKKVKEMRKTEASALASIQNIDKITSLCESSSRPRERCRKTERQLATLQQELRSGDPLWSRDKIREMS